jgi:hypothetical protein
MVDCQFNLCVSIRALIIMGFNWAILLLELFLILMSRLWAWRTVMLSSTLSLNTLQSLRMNLNRFGITSQASHARLPMDRLLAHAPLKQMQHYLKLNLIFKHTYSQLIHQTTQYLMVSHQLVRSTLLNQHTQMNPTGCLVSHSPQLIILSSTSITHRLDSQAI